MSKERAWEWYNAQPWIRGFNGYPSNCVNRVAMWQRYNHKEVFDQIAYEFDIARQTGFNAVRAIIQFEVGITNTTRLCPTSKNIFTSVIAESK
ncbi:MAG: hypothetical protein ACLUSP_11365 [Christensenellales bacterium]